MEKFKAETPLTVTIMNELLDCMHPIGSIFLSVNSDNPGNYLIKGSTWEAWGAGRVPVGMGVAESNDDGSGHITPDNQTRIEKRGGRKDAVLPQHKHSGSVGGDGEHFHTINEVGGLGKDNGVVRGSAGGVEIGITNFPGEFIGQHGHSVEINNSGVTDTASANLPPYITCYMWKRVS